MSKYKAAVYKTPLAFLRMFIWADKDFWIYIYSICTQGCSCSCALASSFLAQASDPIPYRRLSIPL